MFDEVTLSPGLSYNFSTDCMEGIVDFGSVDCKQEFADHTLVFMLKILGNGSNFYFCKGRTPSTDLFRIIKEEFTHNCQTGLTIILQYLMLLESTNSY